jgi:hypothetical protein
MATRRQFIGKAAIAGSAATGAPSLSSFTDKEDFFIHPIYFWLKNPDSQDDKNKLIEGLRKLAKIKTIRTVHMGQPAPTNRDVIDRSYSISRLLFFDNKADQDGYHIDPIHLKFVEECSSLWTKVIVYDSIDI